MKKETPTVICMNLVVVDLILITKNDANLEFL